MRYRHRTNSFSLFDKFTMINPKQDFIYFVPSDKNSDLGTIYRPIPSLRDSGSASQTKKNEDTCIKIPCDEFREALSHGMVKWIRTQYNSSSSRLCVYPHEHTNYILDIDNAFDELGPHIDEISEVIGFFDGVNFGYKMDVGTYASPESLIKDLDIFVFSKSFLLSSLPDTGQVGTLPIVDEHGNHMQGEFKLRDKIILSKDNKPIDNVFILSGIYKIAPENNIPFALDISPQPEFYKADFVGKQPIFVKRYFGAEDGLEFYTTKTGHTSQYFLDMINFLKTDTVSKMIQDKYFKS